MRISVILIANDMSNSVNMVINYRIKVQMYTVHTYTGLDIVSY